MKIAVVGGGIAGLSAAYALTKKGISVSLFEEKQSGKQCSYKAAGMITPCSEVRFGEEKLLEVFLKSLDAYPKFVDELETQTGCQVDFRQEGALSVAIDEDDAADLQRLFEYQKELGLPVVWLSKEETLKKCPWISPKIEAGVYSSVEKSLDNRLMTLALIKGIKLKGGLVFENTKVDDLWIEAGCCKGIVVKNESQKFDQVILCTGLTSTFPSLPQESLPSLRPVKGQAFCLQSHSPFKLPFPLRSVHRFPAYIVPRSDGRLIIGATVEEMGFDENVTAGGIMDLLYGAWRIFPAVYDFPIVETWTGLRPAQKNNQPYIGPTSVANLVAVMGLYRHGFLLAAGISQWISQYCTGEKLPSFLEEFHKTTLPEIVSREECATQEGVSCHGI